MCYLHSHQHTMWYLTQKLSTNLLSIDYPMEKLNQWTNTMRIHRRMYDHVLHLHRDYFRTIFLRWKAPVIQNLVKETM